MKSIRFTFFFFSFFFFSLSISAQPYFQFYDSIPVKISGNFISNPWAGGLNFVQMNVEALRMGLPLASVKNITAHHRNVNLALQGRGVLYDASGNLIEGSRLEECGNAVNNAWVYLNDAYKESK